MKGVVSPESRVIPDHKMDTKANVNNSRTISVLSVASKISEKIVHEQLIQNGHYSLYFNDYRGGFMGVS